MNIIRVFVLLFILSSASFAQNADFNLTQVSNVIFPEGCNDIWGYVDDNGIEYAVIGTRQATVVLSLEDPTQPEQIIRVDGSNTTWRDMKSWDHFVYSICDNCGDGLTIIDMTDPENPQSQVLTSVFDSVNMTSTPLGSFHNIYVDEFGYLYACGGDLVDGGAVIFDVHTDPWNPTIVGYGPSQYAHDIYVRDHRIYASNIYQGIFTIYDATDFDNITILATQGTTGDFTHNAWLSDNSDFLFTTDEIANGFVDAYDISDLNDIRRVDVYQPPSTAGMGVIPHNTHVLNDYLVTSWYTDGVKIIDAQYPDNLVEVGSFDTHTQSVGGFSGDWGAYPFLPSGKLLVSDMQLGLFVFDVTYQRAAYLHGQVTDVVTGANIPQVAVEIDSDKPNSSMTNNFGIYKTGIGGNGTTNVMFTHPLYRDTMIEVTLSNDSISVVDVALQPKYSIVNVLANLTDAAGEPLADVPVIFTSILDEQIFVTDANGHIDEAVLDLAYDVSVGQWGYGDTIVTIDEIPDGPIAISLPGTGDYYSDRFIVDQDWFTQNLATTGFWERGVPQATNFQGPLNPGTDSPFDFGVDCYGTGLVGQTAFDNDVDGVYNTLASPGIFLTGEETTINLDFDFWYRNVDNNGPVNDSLEIFLFHNGTPVNRIMSITDIDTVWRQMPTINVIDFYDNGPLAGEMRIAFRIGDHELGSPLEAAIDNIKIEVSSLVGTKVEQIESSGIRVFPNPVMESLTLDMTQYNGTIEHLRLVDVSGQQVVSARVTGQTFELDLNLEAGMYILLLTDAAGTVYADKLIKL